MGKRLDDLKAAVLARFLKQSPPIVIARRKPKEPPVYDPPRFVDRYQENLDHEFDRTIKEIVAEVKADPNFKKGGSM